jgi:hypothetical protein
VLSNWPCVWRSEVIQEKRAVAWLQTASWSALPVKSAIIGRRLQP